MGGDSRGWAKKRRWVGGRWQVVDPEGRRVKKVCNRLHMGRKWKACKGIDDLTLQPARRWTGASTIKRLSGSRLKIVKKVLAPCAAMMLNCGRNNDRLG